MYMYLMHYALSITNDSLTRYQVQCAYGLLTYIFHEMNQNWVFGLFTSSQCQTITAYCSCK